MSEIVEMNSEIAAKPKRPYKKREPKPQIPAPIPVPPAPEPPNPTILALEANILDLVNQRVMALNESAIANASMNAAKVQVDAANMRLQQLESEVQYRMTLIAQMKGSVPDSISVAAQAQYRMPEPNPHPFDHYNSPNGHGVMIPPGVGSLPAPVQAMRPVQAGPRIRSESAEGFRDEAIGVRAVI